MSNCTRWKPAILVVPVLLVIVDSPVVSNGTSHAAETDEDRNREIQQLLGVIKTKGYYALSDQDAKEALAKLQSMSEYSAPAVAKMLTEALESPRGGWIEVYRPLIILEGLGTHARVALPDVIKVLEVKKQSPPNLLAAARVLEAIGPPAKDALPQLLQTWESASSKSKVKEATANAIKAIDPKKAESLGVK